MNSQQLFYISLSSLFIPISGAKGEISKNEIVKHPNIIFILTDDLGYGDVGVFLQNERAKAKKADEPWFSTPHLDNMARAGAMLTQDYCAAPVSAPSRASIILGVSQGHANVRNNQFDKAIDDNWTLGNVMQQAGYTTIAIGKWGLQGLPAGKTNLEIKDTSWVKQPAWWVAQPLNRGFDYFYGYMRHEDGHEHYPADGVYRGKKQVWNNLREVSQELGKCYTTDLWTAYAKQWIINHEKGKDSDKPFFMYLAYDTPHPMTELPTQAYPKGSGLHGGIQWIGTPGHMINTASGKVDSWIDPRYAHAMWDDDHNPATPEVPWPNIDKRYATVVGRIDDAVGDLLQLLKDLHIASNTLVIFTSDNGPAYENYVRLPLLYNPEFFDSFGHFDGIKRDCWEGGEREPTIACWPGHIPAGKVVRMPTISYDWLPTFAQVGGFTAPPARTDGVSLLPVLTGKGRQHPGLVYVEYYEGGVTPNFKMFSPAHRLRPRKQMDLIRIHDLVGVRYNIQSANDNFEIYNVDKDPQEITNLANDKQYSRLEREMKAKALQVRMPDAGARRPYDNALVPAVKDDYTDQGVVWHSYRGDLPWVPDVQYLHPTATGRLSHPMINKTNIKNGDVVVFSGYLRIPEDGEYTFYFSSQGKAYMRLHEATLIDADYKYQPGIEKEANIRLQAGLHPFSLTIYSPPQGEKLGTSEFTLKWSSPSISKEMIPDAIFYHKK